MVKHNLSVAQHPGRSPGRHRGGGNEKLGAGTMANWVRLGLGCCCCLGWCCWVESTRRDGWSTRALHAHLILWKHWVARGKKSLTTRILIPNLLRLPPLRLIAFAHFHHKNKPKIFANSANGRQIHQLFLIIKNLRSFIDFSLWIWWKFWVEANGKNDGKHGEKVKECEQNQICVK